MLIHTLLTVVYIWLAVEDFKVILIIISHFVLKMNSQSINEQPNVTPVSCDHVSSWVLTDVSTHRHAHNEFDPFKPIKATLRIFRLLCKPFYLIISMRELS